MSISILDHWLQDHGRYQFIVQLPVNLKRLANPISKPLVLHCQIQLDEFDLVAQRDELCISALQRDTQKTSELFQHVVCGANVGAHKTGYAVHGVEQKMRVELHAQSGDLCIGQLNLQLSGGALLLAELLVIADPSQERECAPENHHVIEQIEVQMESQPVPVSHVWQIQGHIGKAEDPNHLLCNTCNNADWQHAGNDACHSCFPDTCAESPPENPADYAPEEILHSPGLELDG